MTEREPPAEIGLSPSRMLHHSTWRRRGTATKRKQGEFFPNQTPPFLIGATGATARSPAVAGCRERSPPSASKAGPAPASLPPGGNLRKEGRRDQSTVGRRGPAARKTSKAGLYARRSTPPIPRARGWSAKERRHQRQTATVAAVRLMPDMRKTSAALSACHSTFSQCIGPGPQHRTNRSPARCG
jgi:hypothetical protein